MARSGLLPPQQFEGFALDESNAMLARDGRPIDLPPKAFDVLCELVRQRGRLVVKDALLDAVWGHRHVSESVLKTTIGQIRAALGDDARAPRFIENVPRRGYRFIAPLQPSPTSESRGAGSKTPAAESPAAAPSTDVASTGVPPSAFASPVASSAPSSPAAFTAPSLPPLVGRQRVLTALHEAWRQALAGQRRIVWLAGEAGIGKTTVIDRFELELSAAVIAIRGQCIEQIGADEPYAPVLEALGGLCHRDAEAARLLRATAPSWMLQLPWLGDADTRASLQRELAGLSQGRMLRELAEFLERFTAARPLLMITEDLHWSDHATVQLIDYVARRRAPARLMWLGSSRPAEVIATGHPFGGLRHELRLHGLCDEIALDPFSQADVAAYLDLHHPGSPAPESFVRRLHAHTDGLPLFVAAAAVDLAEREPGGPAGWQDLSLMQVPPSLAAVVDKLVDRLPPDAAAMLETASLIGVEFRLRTVAEAAGQAVDAVRARCDELVRRQQWLASVPIGSLPDGTLDESYAFRHAIYRQVFLQRIGPAERIARHRRLADSLGAARAAGLPVSAAELAMHEEGGLRLFEASGWYAEAAAAALAQTAAIEAARLAEHALTLLARCTGLTAHQRAERELALVLQRGTASAQQWGVGSRASRESFERASVLCDSLPATPAMAWVYSGLGWTYYVIGDYRRSIALAGRIAALAEQHHDAVLSVCASNLLGVTRIFEGSLREGAELLLRGIAACEGLDERLAQAPFMIDPVVSMRANLGVALTLLGRFDEARAQLDAADERARRQAIPFDEFISAWCRCVHAIELGDRDAAQRDQQRIAQIFERHQIAQAEGPMHWLAARASLPEPDRQALVRLERGYDCHARFGMLAGGTMVRLYGADIALASKDAAEALRQADAGLALADAIGERLCAASLLAAKAEALRMAGGDPSAIGALLNAALEAAREHGDEAGAARAGRSMALLSAAPDGPLRSSPGEAAVAASRPTDSGRSLSAGT